MTAPDAAPAQSLPRGVGRVLSVHTGRVRPYTRPGSTSAIDKQPVAGAVAVQALGLVGDEQADTRHHGGPDKAVHVYAWSHYPWWRTAIGAPEVLQRPGAFGENLSVEGVDEHSVCLGDTWQVGSARLVVTQGRQPCWKLNERFGVPDMARRVQDTGRTGWYLRVLQPGHVQAGDTIQLTARPHPDWPLERLAGLIRARVTDPAVLQHTLALPLPPSWHKLFEQRMASGSVEAWERRLDGTSAAPPA